MNYFIPKRFNALPVMLIAATLAVGQTTQNTAGTAPAATRPAAPAAASSPVDSVIDLVKSGMSEGLIVKTLQRQNKPVDLSPADLVKLKNAGVSENIINVMMDPSSKPAAAPAASAAPLPVAAPAAAQAVPSSSGSPNAQKKRVIVDDFDYSAVMTSVQAIFGTQQNIGKGIHAMLAARLTQQGNVVIVERGSKLDQVQQEQDRNQGNRVKQGTGARVGGITGADAVLAGDITIFGRDDKKVNANGTGGGWCRWCGPTIGAAAGAMSKEKAVVAVAYRLIDAETAEIIDSGAERGESERKSNGFAGFAAGLKGYGAGNLDMTSSNFTETIIGEATQDCVNKLAAIMETRVDAMKKAPRSVEAYVAEVSGNTLVISAGNNDGVNSGDVFEVFRVTQEVKDPKTGEVLDSLTEKVGQMTVTSVRDKIAMGSYVGSAAEIGFLVRKKI